MTTSGTAAVPAAPKAPSVPSRMVQWRQAVRRTVAIVRRIIGVPDYDTYLAHMRRNYPGCTPVDPATFERERLDSRYRSMGSRCC